MLKALLRTLFVLLVLVLAGVSGIYFYAGNIVKKAVETFVPEITQTSASLDSMSISLLKGNLSISGLSLGNPAGFSTPTAFSLKNITVSFVPESLFKEKVIINQVIIDRTQISAEATYQNGALNSNITQIQKNVDAFIKQHTPATNIKAAVQTKKQDPVPASQSKQVVIKDLQINNSNLTVGLMNQSLTVALPNIQKKNIGEQGPKVTWEEAIVSILNMITDETAKATIAASRQIIQQGAQVLLNQATGTLDATKGQADNIIDTVKGLF